LLFPTPPLWLPDEELLLFPQADKNKTEITVTTMKIGMSFCLNRFTKIKSSFNRFLYQRSYQTKVNTRFLLDCTFLLAGRENTT